MKKKHTQSGESVKLTGEKRDLGHGKQVKVIYSDGTQGWEHPLDLID